jgi:hypothetical protein
MSAVLCSLAQVRFSMSAVRFSMSEDLFSKSAARVSMSEDLFSKSAARVSMSEDLFPMSAVVFQGTAVLFPQEAARSLLSEPGAPPSKTVLLVPTSLRFDWEERRGMLKGLCPEKSAGDGPAEFPSLVQIGNGAIRPRVRRRFSESRCDE